MVLSKEDFLNKVQERIGNDTSDDAIKFVEDMTDTYSDLERKSAAASSVDWEQKYNDLDAKWRKLYTTRFFSSGDMVTPEDKETDETEKKDVTINDLFERKDK